MKLKKMRSGSCFEKQLPSAQIRSHQITAVRDSLRQSMAVYFWGVFAEKLRIKILSLSSRSETVSKPNSCRISMT